MNNYTQLVLLLDELASLHVPPHLYAALSEVLYWRIPANHDMLVGDLASETYEEARTWFSAACAAYPALYKLTTLTHGYSHIAAYLHRYKAIPLTAEEASLL
jgi:hypothetical protein